MHVSNYSNIQTLLADLYAERKRQRPGFSFGTWAKRLGLKSPSTLVMIVNGQRRPSLALAAKMADELRLSSKDRAYFLDLVRLSHAAKDPEGAALVAARLGGAEGKTPFQRLGPDAFAAISQWHFYAIRELLRLADFCEDPVWMAKRLSAVKARRVGVREIKKALSAMERLGLLSRDAKGALIAPDTHLDTSSDVADEGLKRYHEEIAALTTAAIRSVPPPEREISGVTLAIKESALPKAKALIREFQRQLVSMCEAADQADRIYHLEVAFLPLTTPGHNSSKELH